MSRKPTPVNVLDELLPAQSETSVIRQALRWDYSQAGDAADEVRGHAIEIKRGERRASEAIVEAGRHLIAVKGLLPHGSWEDWLSTEFRMSDRTARRMMAVTEQFDGKTDTVSVLGPSVLYLLAGDSVPEPAREAVIDMAKSGETVTKAKAQEIIEQHKPKPEPVHSENNGYASQMQIEAWLLGIEGTAAELRDAAENLDGNLYDLLSGRAWRDRYLLSPITTSAALRNVAANREYKERKVTKDSADALQVVLTDIIVRYAITHFDSKDAALKFLINRSDYALGCLEQSANAQDIKANRQQVRSAIDVAIPQVMGRDDWGKRAVQRSQAAVAEYHAGQPAAPVTVVDDDDEEDDAAFAAAPLPKAVQAANDTAQWRHDKVGKLARLISIYKLAIATFNEYGDLIGAYTETIPAQRELEKLIAHLEREAALLDGRKPADAWMVEEAE